MSVTDASNFFETLLQKGLRAPGFLDSSVRSPQFSYLMSPAARSKFGNLTTLDNVILEDIHFNNAFFHERPNPGMIVTQLRMNGPGTRLTVPCPKLEISPLLINSGV